MWTSIVSVLPPGGGVEGLRHPPPDGSAAPRRVLRLAALLALSALSACTFYTGGPDQAASNNSGTGNAPSGGTGGGTSNGGTNGAADGGAADGGAADGGDAPSARAWLEAAGSLEGRNAACGVISIAAHPLRDEMLVGIDGFGVWSSAEEGTWRPLGTSRDSAIILNGVNCLAFDPADPDVFWEAGMYNGPGGYRTDDGGETFVQLGALKHADSIAVDFTDPDRKTLVSGPHERDKLIFKSVDGGETWTDIVNLPDGFGFSSNVAVLDAETYLVGVSNGILRTSDGGSNWEVVSRLGGFQAPLLASTGYIYWNAEGNLGLMRSTDRGRTWERIVGASVLNASRPPVELPDGRLAALQGQAVVISDDDGFSWKKVGQDAPFMPKGFTYSPARKAFYVMTDSCNVPIPADAILKLSFDWQNE